jgi:uncharacterized membrane protein YraQ (UPF0718 family)
VRNFGTVAVWNRHVLFAASLILVAIVILFWWNATDQNLYTLASSYQTFVTIFLGIFIEALPFLLLGTVASGLVEIFLSRETLSRVVPHNRLGSVISGALMGLAFPVCECGVVPLTRRLYRKGLPLSVGVAFLLAAPIINPIVITSTYAAFGWSPVFVGRFAFALLIATATGLIFSLAPHPFDLLERSAWPESCSNEQDDGAATEAESADAGNTPEAAVSRHASLSVRLTRALSVAGDEFFEMGRFLVIGCLLAAGMQTIVPQSTLLAVGGGTLSSVIAMLVLAFVLSVCSTVDAFLALAFVNTFSSGSILAFLVFGPMVDVKSVIMFSSVFRRRVVLYLVLLPLMMALFLGVYLNTNVGW